MTENTSTESFAELFGQSSGAIKEGEVVKGTILAIDDDNIQVDVG